MALRLKKLDHSAVSLDHQPQQLLPGEPVRELLDNLGNLESQIPSAKSVAYQRSISDSGQQLSDDAYLARYYALCEVRLFSGGQDVTIEHVLVGDAGDEAYSAEVNCLQRAYQWLFGVGLRDRPEQNFNADLAHRLHRQLMPAGSAPDAGILRTLEAAPTGSAAGFKYINPDLIPAELDALFDYCSKHLRDIACRAEAFQLAAVFLERFLLIHPYRDGNGRTGRLLCSLLLRASGCLTVPLLFNFATLRNSSGNLTLCREEYMSALEGARGATPFDTAPPSLLACFLVLAADRTLRLWLSDFCVVGTKKRRHRSSSHKDDNDPTKFL